MSLIDELLRIARPLAGPVLRVLVAVARAIAGSSDPLRTAKRALAAAASEEASEAALQKILGRGDPK
jgi:hypothetical protein